MNPLATFNRFSLGNGIPVFVYRNPEESKRPRTGITACLPSIGGWTDPPDAPGTAHFREHIGYQGTPTYPDYDAVIGALKAAGCERHARTTQTHTVYTIRPTLEKLAAALPILGEVICHPLIGEERVAHERDIIAAEYRERYVLPGRMFLHWLLPKIYGAHPLGHPPIGTPDSFCRMTTETVQAFQWQHYQAANLNLICSGDLPADGKLMALLESAFGQLAGGEAFTPPPPPLLPHGQTIAVSDRDFRIDFLYTYYFLPKPSARTHLALEEIADYLGSEDGNPLCMELREKRRLIYSGKGLTLFDRGFHHATLRFQLPVQRKHHATACAVIGEAISGLTEAAWRTHREHRHPRHDSTHIPAGRGAEKIKEALCSQESPESLLEAEALRDSLCWDDIRTGRELLLQTQPFTVRVFAQ